MQAQSSKVNFKQSGYTNVSPYLTCKDAEKQLEFLVNVLGAKQHHITRMPDGTIRHADVVIGDSHIMFAQANDQWQARPHSIYLYVEDCDAVYKRAVAFGAKSLMEPADQFHGDRYGGVADANDNYWWLVTHIEDVSPEEMKRREAEMMK